MKKKSKERIKTIPTV